MPNPSIVRFDYDPTGVNSDNLVSNEIHALTDHYVRAFSPTYGPFFADSVVLFDNANDRQLVRGIDYSITELNQDITLRLGKEVSSVVLVLNASVSNAVRMTYQVVGGLYQNQADAIANMYQALLQDNRPIEWANVLGKPLSFPPTLHLHNLQDVYGFEPVVNAIERIRSAIILSDVPAFETLVDWVTGQVSTFGDYVANEALARIAGDNNLSAALQQEINNRTTGDSNLLGLIQAETTNRTTGDSNLLGLIQAETTNRVNADNTKQPLLGFTPAQQGGGVDQLPNKVYVGWGSNSRVRITIDYTDMGNVVFDGQLNAALGNYLPISGGYLTGKVWSHAANSSTALNDASASMEIRNASGAGDAGVAALSFHCQGNYAIKLHLRNDGVFGLGGWSRSAWSWYSDASGNMVAAGNIGAYSDPRLKENFQEITDPFAVIDGIQGYRFNWNRRSKLIENKWDKEDVGFKADAVKQALPLAVNSSMKDEENDETYDLVAYDKLIPFHNEALKALRDRIDVLEAKMSTVDKLVSQYQSVKDKVKTFISKTLNK